MLAHRKGFLQRPVIALTLFLRSTPLERHRSLFRDDEGRTENLHMGPKDNVFSTSLDVFAEWQKRGRLQGPFS